MWTAWGACLEERGTGAAVRVGPPREPRDPGPTSHVPNPPPLSHTQRYFCSAQLPQMQGTPAALQLPPWAMGRAPLGSGHGGGGAELQGPPCKAQRQSQRSTSDTAPVTSPPPVPLPSNLRCEEGGGRRHPCSISAAHSSKERWAQPPVCPRAPSRWGLRSPLGSCVATQTPGVWPAGAWSPEPHSWEGPAGGLYP